MKSKSKQKIVLQKGNIIKTLQMNCLKTRYC